MGCRKVREYLIELGHPIGRRHCTTLFRKLGIHCIYRKPRTTIPHSGQKVYPYLLRHMEIVKPNQVWAMDITYIPMAKGFIYLTCLMDIFISNTLDARFCVEAYEEAVTLYGSPEIINTDQGSQFTSDAFVAAVATSGARLSMDGKGSWTDNIFIERFRRSLKYEEVYLRAYDTVADAKRWIYRYIERYNTIRPHSSLGGKTPDKIHAIAPAEGLLKGSWEDRSIHTYF
jgi:putative transposase